jgi:hypothetical protein
MPAPIRFFAAFIATATLAGGALQPGYADVNSDALKAITDTADRICGVVAAAGESQSVKVTGDLKAQLSGLAKRLADLGISGTGSFDADNYVGVLQSDLPTALGSLRECKLKVFDKLEAKLITGTGTAPTSTATASPVIPDADSDWVDGNSYPGERFCILQLRTIQVKYPEFDITMQDLPEGHKSEYNPFKHDLYRYRCSFSVSKKN